MRAIHSQGFARLSGTLSAVLALDRDATFRLALGLFAAAALVVSLSGWVLFLRDRAAHKLARANTSSNHHEVAEGS